MRTLTCSVAIAAGLLSGCADRRSAPEVPAPLALTAVRYGKLVDAYVPAETGVGRQRLATDVFLAPDVTRADAAGVEVIGTNPDTGNERLLVRSPETLARLGAAAPVLTPGLAVPRDAVLELRFDRAVPGGQGFCATLDAAGTVAGLTNAHAVRLVEQTADGARAIPARIVVRGDTILVDPVLVGSEATSWRLPSRGAGMAADARVELRIAVGGPLALPGLRSADGGDIVLPFQTLGPDAPGGGVMAGGASLRLLGALTMYLEKVEDVNATTQELTLFKDLLAHDIDDLDVIRLYIDNSGIPVAVTEVVADPTDDRGLPAVSHVRVLVARTPGLRENDPRRLPNYPSNPRSVEGERWLVANAPRAVLLAEFAAERRIGGGPIFGDDPRNFVQWSPAPLPNADGTSSEPGDHVSPFAGAVVRFNRPVDPATVRASDSLFFATRDVLDLAAMLQFVLQRGIDPATFSLDKFRTPHLVAATVAAIDGSDTAFRLQAPMGFHLDAAMRQADANQAFANKRFHYHLHVASGRDGIRDRAGNQLDLQFLSVRAHVTARFALDMRRTGSGQPMFADNHVVSLVRRFATRDEDEQPSYYIADEVQRANSPPNANAFPLDDLFGAVVYLPDGRLQARPTSRVRAVADDLNQPAPPSQASPLRWCPEFVAGEPQVPGATAAVPFGGPIQNPTNPFGARLQTSWREIDLGLSRTDPFDFNLDVERMHWGVYRNSSVLFDEFDTVSLFLGHGEYRPENCVGSFSALPTLASSGMQRRFEDNYVHNLDRAGNKEDAAVPHTAFRARPWVIDPSTLVREPNNVNRYATMPALERPYFTWRDEQVMGQGGNSGQGWDTRTPLRTYEPYILAPGLQGQGRLVSVVNNMLQFNRAFWSNAQHGSLDGTNRVDTRTGGALGAIALPLLADVWVEPFGASERPRPHGANGWQIALAVQSSAMPAYRAYSSGGVVNGLPIHLQDGMPGWRDAVGGYTPNGQRTIPTDNSVYWAMVDFVKRKSVVTGGFAELLDPHRIPDPTPDPRLGPYFARAFPAGQKVVFAPLFDPPLDRLPPGTSVTAEYRGAGAVDPQAWRALADLATTRPDAKNFPLDPFKAIDAHIRKDDQRPVSGQPRDWWTHLYNRNVTAYTDDPADLSDPTFIARFAGPRDAFTPDDVRYVNWRLVLSNAIDGPNPAAPALESFALVYRFESR